MMKKVLTEKEIKKLTNNIKLTEKYYFRISKNTWDDISKVPELTLSYVHHFNDVLDLQLVFINNKNLTLKFIKRYWNDEHILAMLTQNKYVPKDIFEYCISHLDTDYIECFIDMLAYPSYEIMETGKNYSNLNKVWGIVFRNKNMSALTKKKYADKIKDLQSDCNDFYVGQKVHNIMFPYLKFVVIGKEGNLYACLMIDTETDADYNVTYYKFQDLVSGWVDINEE